jgi:PAS domain S-box-containing protein
LIEAQEGATAMKVEKMFKEESLFTILLDSCINGITLSDPNRKDCPIAYVNAAFGRLTGYRDEEILGRNCRFLQGEDRDQENIKLIREAIAEKRGIECELRNYKKNGQLFYNFLSVSPIFDSTGDLIYFLGIQHDITKQVVAAEELKRMNKFLEEFIRHP